MRPLHKWAIATGIFATLWAFLILLILAPGGGNLTERDLERAFTKILNENRQALFGALHPVGTAQAVTVHDVYVNWRREASGEAPNEPESVTVTFTLHWEGPLTRNGYTKIRTTYDFDLDAYTHQEIVATNGVTNEDIGYAVGFIFGLALGEALGW